MTTTHHPLFIPERAIKMNNDLIISLKLGVPSALPSKLPPHYDLRRDTVTEYSKREIISFVDRILCHCTHILQWSSNEEIAKSSPLRDIHRSTLALIVVGESSLPAFSSESRSRRYEWGRLLGILCLGFDFLDSLQWQVAGCIRWKRVAVDVSLQLKL